MRNEAVDRPDERALAATGWPGDEEDLTGVDREREVVEGRLRGAPISEGEPLDVDDALGRGGRAQGLRILTS
jgi:hypothetical protein